MIIGNISIKKGMKMLISYSYSNIPIWFFVYQIYILTLRVYTYKDEILFWGVLKQILQLMNSTAKVKVRMS